MDIIAAAGIPLHVRDVNHFRDIYEEALESGKTFLDAIHGHIPVHPLLVHLIDTEQFQRLRYIRMLGPAYFVFPSGNHTRFEHCIGVSHLAREFVSSLRCRQPELKITKQDVLCVMVAGLCHDLGHGPFSHTFENFIHEVIPETIWKHEQASIAMFRFLVESNNMRPIFAKFGLYDVDIMFIQELITGQRGVARPPEKAFLYEIVANKRNGIDVDRFDYIDRDCYHTNVKGSFENRRFFDNARVVCVEHEWQICFRDKVVPNVRGFFELRCDLHRKVYQHKVNRLIEQMLIDLLVSADKFLLFPGRDGKTYRMSEAVNHMPAYLLMDDTVLSTIRSSTLPELQTSRELLARIHRRELYRYVKRTTPSANLQCDLTALKMELASLATQEVGYDVRVADIAIVRTQFDYGMGSENPLEKVCFFSKEKPDKPKILYCSEISTMLPATWLEVVLAIYYKVDDQKVVDALDYAITQWANKNQIAVKTHMKSMDRLETKLAFDDLSDVILPDANLSAVKSELFKLYAEIPADDSKLRSVEDVIKLLDTFELSKVRNPHIKGSSKLKSGHSGHGDHGTQSPESPPSAKSLAQ